MPRVILTVLFISVARMSLCVAQDIEVPFDYGGLDSLKIFRSLEAALSSTEPVYRLHLDGQKLKTFPEEILQLKDLRELDLSSNKIKSIPNGIGELQQLEILRFMRNKISEIPPTLFQIEALRLLDFGGNDIAEIPDEISQLKNLSHLLFWGNVLAFFSPELQNLPKLKELDLLNNDMSKKEQSELLEILPEVMIHLSAPCNCNFE